jgi:hypothetical protein
MKILVYPFDDEHDSFEFDSDSIPKDKDRFFVVLDEVNKATMIAEACMDLAREGLVIIKHGDEPLNFSEMIEQIAHNKKVLMWLAAEFGFKFTTLEGLAEEMA